MSFQFLLGISNIAGIAAMQVYINDKNMLALSPEKAALVMGIITPTAMLLSMRVWGFAFDRMSIVTYRILTSCVIGFGFVVLPFGGFWSACVAAAVWGVGRGGGQLAWSLGILDFCSGRTEFRVSGNPYFSNRLAWCGSTLRGGLCDRNLL